MTSSHGPPPPSTSADGPDPVDVERLYREHGRRVLGYALRRATTREDALDVVAETFLTAWRRRGDIPVDQEAHLPWLLATAGNCARNAARGARRADHTAAAVVRELGGLAVPDPADIHQARAAHGDLAAALAALPDDDRELVVLVSWDGLTPAAAGAVLGVTAGAARVRLHRARTRLRSHLARLDEASATSPERKAGPR